MTAGTAVFLTLFFPPKKPYISSESLTIVFLLRIWEHGPKHCWRQGFLHLVCHLWDSTVWLFAGWDWRPTWNHLWEGYCKGGKSFPSKLTANFLFVLYNLLLILLLTCIPFYMLGTMKYLHAWLRRCLTSLGASVLNGEKQMSLDGDAGVTDQALNFLMRLSLDNVSPKLSSLQGVVVKKPSKHHRLIWTRTSIL